MEGLKALEWKPLVKDLYYCSNKSAKIQRSSCFYRAPRRYLTHFRQCVSAKRLGLTAVGGCRDIFFQKFSGGTRLRHQRARSAAQSFRKIRVVCLLKYADRLGVSFVRFIHLILSDPQRVGQRARIDATARRSRRFIEGDSNHVRTIEPALPPRHPLLRTRYVMIIGRNLEWKLKLEREMRSVDQRLDKHVSIKHSVFFDAMAPAFNTRQSRNVTRVATYSFPLFRVSRHPGKMKAGLT